MRRQIHVLECGKTWTTPTTETTLAIALQNHANRPRFVAARFVIIAGIDATDGKSHRAVHVGNGNTENSGAITIDVEL